MSKSVVGALVGLGLTAITIAGNAYLERRLTETRLRATWDAVQIIQSPCHSTAKCWCFFRPDGGEVCQDYEFTEREAAEVMSPAEVRERQHNQPQCLDYGNPDGGQPTEYCQDHEIGPEDIERVTNGARK